MFIDVTDQIESYHISGWRFKNKYGQTEYVKINEDVLQLEDANGGSMYLFKDDINKLIRALQQAKEYFKV